MEQPNSSYEVLKSVHNSDLNTLNVTQRYLNLIPADYYLYKTNVTPSITSAVTIWDTVVNVDSTTGITAGDVVTMYEGERMFQTLITSATTDTIILAAPIDYEFTSGATVEIGDWNMAVDGSTTPYIFSIKAPQLADIDIHTINVSMLDSSAMDDGKFGGIPQLDKGITFRYYDGIKKNLALIVNNLGFYEIGFDTSYSDKAPSGKYGFRARRDIPKVNGVTLRLDKGGNAQFLVVIQDDLTDLDLVTMVINGHLNGQ